MRSLSPTAGLDGRAAERRTHHRVLLGAAAWLVVGGQRYPAECINVSMGGAAVKTNAPLASGALLRLELGLGNDRGVVSIHCEAVRLGKTELGLRFVALDRPSLEAVLSLL